MRSGGLLQLLICIRFCTCTSLRILSDDPYDYEAFAKAASLGHSEMRVPNVTAATIPFLKTFRVCGKCQNNMPFRRIGDPLTADAKADGGYIMCQNTLQKGGMALSIGINGWDGWGIQISDEFRVPVYQYDCTNLKTPLCPPGRNCNMTFYDVCADNGSGAQIGNGKQKTLAQMISDHAPSESAADLILKIDCEGCEWGVLTSAPEQLLARFRTIVVEFHRNKDARYGVHKAKLAVMQKMLKYFTIVHSHGCNWNRVAHYGAYRIPSTLEVTFVRNDLVEPVTCLSSQHLDIDKPINPRRNEYGELETVLPTDDAKAYA